MKIINIPLLDCQSEEEFRQIFEDKLVNGNLIFNGYPIKIIKDDFDHAFFEKSTGSINKGKFGIRRAKRMLFVKEICANTIPYVLYWEIDREDQELCVLCEQAETGIYLKARRSDKENFFILKTIIAYGQKVESKIEKQKKCKRIEDLSVLFEEAD